MSDPKLRPDVVIVGGGIFGATAALALRARGAGVSIVDEGPLPHPDASSTDISKLVRADYGKDAFYTELMERALPRWREMNERLGAELFHETGLLVLSSGPMARGSFEGDSFELLTSRGHPLERLSARDIHARFPAWAESAYEDGYVNPRGGWAESGRVVSALLEEAKRAGVRIREGVRVKPIVAGESRVDGIELASGERIGASCVVVAAGAFTPVIVPELADRLVPIAQNVMHFSPADARAFSPPSFLPWAADISRTGWYGFTHHEGVVKVANHGPGTRVDPAAPRVVPASAEAKFRAFFEHALPGLAKAPVAKTRVCLYCDAFDGDFLVDRHPTREGLVVASGGSGHAFKFAPVIGDMIADRVMNEGEGEWRQRFRWRERAEKKLEAARSAT
jgi:glycine/D-amino acid oxidase-like deaminating enzyme